MFREATDSLTQSRRAANRLRTRGSRFAREMPTPEIQTPSPAKVAGITALALAAGLAYYFGPDLVRYLKIRRM